MAEESNLGKEHSTSQLPTYVPTGLDLLAQRIDALFPDDIQKIAAVGQDILSRLNHPLASKSSDVKRAVLTLQLNAQSSIVGAIELWRRGLVLQVGMLLRNALEVLATAVCITADKSVYDSFVRKQLKSSSCVTDVKRFFFPLGPSIGSTYGWLSNEFTHIGKDFYRTWHLVHANPTIDDIVALRAMLMPMKYTLHTLDLLSDLTCYDLCEVHRYWAREAPNRYKFHRSPELLHWVNDFFGERPEYMYPNEGQ